MIFAEFIFAGFHNNTKIIWQIIVDRDKELNSSVPPVGIKQVLFCILGTPKDDICIFHPQVSREVLQFGTVIHTAQCQHDKSLLWWNG